MKPADLLRLGAQAARRQVVELAFDARRYTEHGKRDAHAVQAHAARRRAILVQTFLNDLARLADTDHQFAARLQAIIPKELTHDA